MCKEDVRLARKAGGYSYTRSVAQSAVSLVDTDRNRYALVISAPLAGNLLLSWGEQPTTAAGVVIPAGAGPLVLDIQHHGALVTEQVWAIMDAGTVNIGVAVSSLSEDIG